MASGFNMRVGDAERETTATQLRDHYADGRLTLDELNERLDATFAAKTNSELNAVMRDLPRTGQQTVGAGPAGYQGRTGRQVPNWQGPRWQGPNWQGSSAGDGGRQQCGRSVFSAFMALAVLMIALVSIGFFGIGHDKPLVIVVILAVMAAFRRIFGVRRRMGRRTRRGRFM